MLLRNAWYIAAWADEIGGGQPLARRICDEPIVLFRDGDGPGGGARRPMLPPRRAAQHGQRCGGGDPMRLSRPRHRRIGPLCAHPRQKQIPGGRSRAQLSRCRKRPVGVGLDGRPGEGRCQPRSPTTPTTTTRQMAQQARRLSDQGQLHADGRQFDGPDASRLSARQDGGRQSGGACRGRNEDGADSDRRQIHPLDEKFGAAADLCQGGGLQGPRRSLAGVRIRRPEQRAAMDWRGRCRHRRL